MRTSVGSLYAKRSSRPGRIRPGTSSAPTIRPSTVAPSQPFQIQRPCRTMKSLSGLPEIRIPRSSRPGPRSRATRLKSLSVTVIGPPAAAAPPSSWKSDGAWRRKNRPAAARRRPGRAWRPKAPGRRRPRRRPCRNHPGPGLPEKRSGHGLSGRPGKRRPLFEENPRRSPPPGPLTRMPSPRMGKNLETEPPGRMRARCMGAA